MHNDNPSAGDREHVWKRVRDIRFGVLTTVADDGKLHARPMTNQQVEESGEIVFFVGADGEVGNLAPGTEVNVTYADPRDNFFASLAGTATVMRDTALAEKLWSKLDEAWFPAGPTDPNLAVLKLRVSSVDYWDARSSRIVQFLLMAKAAFTKTPPTNIGEHGTFRP